MFTTILACLIANIITIAAIVGVVYCLYKKNKESISDKLGILESLKKFLDRFLSGI